MRWKGDDEAKRAFYNNRARLLSGVARQAFKLRAELVERGFALTLDRGGMRRAWLRGRDNLQKRHLIDEQTNLALAYIVVINRPHCSIILGIHDRNAQNLTELFVNTLLKQAKHNYVSFIGPKRKEAEASNSKYYPQGLAAFAAYL